MPDAPHDVLKKMFENQAERFKDELLIIIVLSGFPRNVCMAHPEIKGINSLGHLIEIFLNGTKIGVHRRKSCRLR